MGDEIKYYSWGHWVIGVIIAVFVGGALDIAAVAGGAATGNTFLGLVIGAAPGVLMALFARRVNQEGFGQGFLTGAIFIALVGGVCGGGLANLKIR